MIKVILDADTIRMPLTGIGRYTQALCRELSMHPDLAELRVLRSGTLQAAESGLMPKRAGMVLGGKVWLRQFASRLTLAARLYRGWLAWRTSRVLAAGDVGAVLHGPNYTVPAVGYDGPIVVTIHDLSIYDWADCHPKARTDSMRRAIPLALKRATMIITDSEFNRQEIIQRFGIEPERIVSVPLACDSVYHPRSRESLADRLASYGLSPQGYGLFVGTVEPRKNLLTLLEVWRDLPEALRYNCPLVVVGGAGWHSSREHALIREGVDAGWVRYPGYVSEEDLPWIYAGSRLFCFPSFYEGFGLPVLEAMASGVPVISSDAASLPEVGGVAVRYVSSSDSAGWRRAVTEVLLDPVLRAHMSALGLERAARFSWRQTADDTMAVYAAAVARHARARQVAP